MAKLPIRIPQFGPRTRKLLFVLGMVLLAFVSFLFAFQLVFPYDRAADRLEALAASKVDLHIGSVKRSIIPGRFFLEDVTIKTHPSKEDLDHAMAIADPKERDKQLALASTTVFVDEIEVDIGLLSLIGGKASIDFVAKLDDGRISGNFAVSKSNTSVSIDGSEVPSERLPMREALSNLPMSGTVNFEVSLDLPNEKLKTGKVGPNWTHADASLEFDCPDGCVIGDGKAKLKLKAKNSRSQAFAGDGTEFGRVKIQSLAAKAELKDGKLDITKWEVQSSDLELHVDYTMTLAENIDQSAVLGCIRFKPTAALRKREPKTYDQILLTGAARDMSTGLDNIKLQGTFKHLKKLAKMCGPNAASSGGDIDSSPSRPNLTVHTPDAPLHAPTPPSKPTPAPPPPTTAIPKPTTTPAVPAGDRGSAAAGSNGADTGAAAGSGSDADAAEPQPVPEPGSPEAER